MTKQQEFPKVNESAEKYCPKCQLELPIDNFGWRMINMKKYRQSWCLKCRNAKPTENAVNVPEPPVVVKMPMTKEALKDIYVQLYPGDTYGKTRGPKIMGQRVARKIELSPEILETLPNGIMELAVMAVEGKLNA